MNVSLWQGRRRLLQDNNSLSHFYTGQNIHTNKNLYNPKACQFFFFFFLFFEIELQTENDLHSGKIMQVKEQIPPTPPHSAWKHLTADTKNIMFHRFK